MLTILMGDDTTIEVHRRGVFDVGEGKIQDIIFVPYLLANIQFFIISLM